MLVVANTTDTSAPFYRLPVEDVLIRLQTQRQGLSSEEVQKRLADYGENSLQTETRINRLKLFVEQFKSFIIYIMLIAGLISLALGEYADASVIGLILLINALIGYYQELNAQKSLEALKKLSVQNARTYRDGNLQDIDARNLVPGDVISLAPGDRVPADCRLLHSNELKVEESALTGESVPSDKHAAALEENAQLGDQLNMLFSSTTISEGSGTAVVVRTGMDTEIGKITELVQSAEEQLTPLQQRLDTFGRQLGYGVLVICFIVLAVIISKDYFIDQDLDRESVLDAFLVAVALAVAAVPSGLPAVVTIALSLGVKRLLQRNALVRKLSSVETLGSGNVICSDKTGTLTQNQMMVVHAWTPAGGEVTLEGSGYHPEGAIQGAPDKLLFEIGLTNNNAQLFQKEGQWRITGNPTEAALLVSAYKAGVTRPQQRHDEMPFSSDRKRMSVWVERGDGFWTYTKGAPDRLLAVCTSYWDGAAFQPLDEATRQRIQQQVEHYSGEALRVLALAAKPAPHKADFNEDDLGFVGLQAMYDPPRPEVMESIKLTNMAGIRVIMVTGDYAATAQAIGRNLGITGRALSGAELETMSDAALDRALREGVNIFARVAPVHKQRIVNVLQGQGHVVAMTGDGVNDAPALKKANIGVAVGSGTDVAKEASDFVLLNDSFTNIVNAIEEGRGIYENIQKAIMHLLSGNLSEVLIIFLSVMLGWELPLTAIMLLWINLVSDGAPALTLAVDPYGKDLMERPPKSSATNILPRAELTLTSVLGVWSTLLALMLFYQMGGAGAEAGSVAHSVAQTGTFTFVVIAELILLLSVRQFFGIPIATNRWLWGAIGFILLLQAALVYTPFGQQVFDLQPLDVNQLGWVGGFILLLIGLAFGTQAVVKKRFQQTIQAQ